MEDIIYCEACGVILSHDEIALNKKLLGIEIETFLCIDCLAEDLGTTVSELQNKIEDFKESGCTLFED